jgi:ketosteroid isomerase-like protein
MYHVLFTFTPDGKITAVREYNDTAYMRASFAG